MSFRRSEKIEVGKPYHILSQNTQLALADSGSRWIILRFTLKSSLIFIHQYLNSIVWYGIGVMSLY